MFDATGVDAMTMKSTSIVLISAAALAIAGYLYYYFIGCHST